MFVESAGVNMNDDILIIGDKGELGTFLRTEIIPPLCNRNILGLDKNTTELEKERGLLCSSDIILCLPLNIYVEETLNILNMIKDKKEVTTLWLIPSVQEPVVKAIKNRIKIQALKNISIVVLHPMYGPHGFEQTKNDLIGRREFYNILTVIFNEEQVKEKVTNLFEKHENVFKIVTKKYTPRQHDEITANSQGLSYCVALVLFESVSVAREFEQMFPVEFDKLYSAFKADRELIQTFSEVNEYFAGTSAQFKYFLNREDGLNVYSLLKAFMETDKKQNGDVSEIPTKQYSLLQDVAGKVVS